MSSIELSTPLWRARIFAYFKDQGIFDYWKNWEMKPIGEIYYNRLVDYTMTQRHGNSIICWVLTLNLESGEIKYERG
jgi:hypothetical protein